jgi:PAS domain S-box-containing protein
VRVWRWPSVPREALGVALAGIGLAVAVGPELARSPRPVAVVLDASATGHLQNLIADLEITRRGWLLSGSATQRGQVENLAERVELELAVLGKRLPQDTEAEQHFKRLQVMVEEILREARRTQDAPAAGRVEAAGLDLVALLRERIEKTAALVDDALRPAPRPAPRSPWPWAGAAIGLVGLVALGRGLLERRRYEEGDEALPEEPIEAQAGPPDAGTVSATASVDRTSLIRALVQALGDAVIAVDEFGKILATNEEADRILSRGGLYMEPGKTSRTENPILAALRGEVRSGEEFCAGKPSDPESRWVRLEAQPLVDDQGENRGALVVMRDITELRGARLSLDLAERRFSQFFAQASVAAALIQPDGRFLQGNAAFQHAFGYGEAELGELSFWRLTHAEDAAHEEELTARLLAGEVSSVELDKRVRNGQGGYRPGHWRLAGLRDAEGQVRQVLALGEAASVPAPSASLDQAALKSLLAALPFGVWVADDKARVVESNEAARELWPQRDPVGPLPTQEYKLWWAESGKRISPSEWGAQRVLRSGEAVLGEVIEVQRFDGTRKTVRASTVPCRDAEGNVAGAVVMHEDITEKKRLTSERDETASRVEELAGQVKALHGLLPVCPACGKDREDPTFRPRLKAYIQEHQGELREAACVECSSRAYTFWGELLAGGRSR